MPHHIGIVACSAEEAALCYKTVCVEGAALFGSHNHPEVPIHTPPTADYLACFDKDDWSGVGDLMLASANKLAQVQPTSWSVPTTLSKRRSDMSNRLRRCLGYILRTSPPKRP